VAKLFKEAMRLEMAEGSIDFIKRLGRRMGQHPILAKLTSFAMKLSAEK
jgi:hypothetical protein